MRLSFAPTPGNAYPPGYYSNRVMADLQSEQRLARKYEWAKKFHKSGKIDPLNESYDLPMCMVCGEEFVLARAMCSACYRRWHRNQSEEVA